MDHGDDAATAAEQPTDGAQTDVVDELRSLVAEARAGNRDVLPRLREYMDANPSLWMVEGDLAIQAQGAWVKLICGRNGHWRQCITRKVAQLKRELLGPSPSAMERLVVDRIATAWLQVHYYEMLDAQQDEKSLRWARFRLERLERTHRRYLKSMGALEVLQRFSASLLRERRVPRMESQPQRLLPASSTNERDSEPRRLDDRSGSRSTDASCETHTSRMAPVRQ